MNGIAKLREATGLPLSEWRAIYAIYRHPVGCPCGVPHPVWTPEEAREMLRHWMDYALELREEARSCAV